MSCDVCDPVGAIDIAKRLKVKDATVKTWQYRDLLPEPPWTVSGRPCWDWSTIEAWARATGRFHDETD
jgi:hypothetical protein